VHLQIVSPEEAHRLLDDEVLERFQFTPRYPPSAIRMPLRVLLDHYATHELLLVIAPEGDVIGHISLDPGDESGARRISLIEIAGPAQRHGYGLKALRAVQERARSQQVGHLLAQIAPDNVASRHLFARAGFRLVPARPGFRRRQGAFDSWRWSARA
jgi:RimJ/RimL family protein N-acetyltransferase